MSLGNSDAAFRSIDTAIGGSYFRCSNFSKIRKVGTILRAVFRALVGATARGAVCARVAVIAAAVIGLPSVAGAQLKSFSTDHYVISFTAGAEGTARRVAEVAEEVFGPLAAAYGYYDRYSPIHILVLDNTDSGNGFADEYSSSVVIWASNLDWEIRGEHPWIKNVLTHEIAHVMTLTKARKGWPFRFALFSVSKFDSNPDISFTFPLYYLNAPRWWSEGIAQMSSYQFGWDTWDSHRDMLLRMAALEDDLLAYEEMGTVASRTGGYRGEQVYNQGYALLVYIQSQYGREKLEALGDHVGSLSFDPAIREVLGISADQLYDDWQRYIEDNYRQQVAELRAKGLFEGESLDNLNGGVLDYHPAYSPDGSKLAYISSQDRDYRIPKLLIHDFETGDSEELEEFVDTRVSWSPDGEEVVFLRNKGGFNDLYIYNLPREEERRISAGLRARDPHFSPDGDRIALVRNEDGNANLCLINRDGTGLEYLTNNNDGTQIYSPRWSPDGEWLLFTIFRGEDRDIAMMRSDSPPRPKSYGIRERNDVTPDSLKVFPDSLAFPAADSSGFAPLLATTADERDPFWLPDGSGFVFASDRTGIFNIYRYSMATGEVKQLTNVVGGAFSPTVSSDGRVAYASYHSNDYELFEFELDEYGQRETQWGSLLARDYQSTFEGPKLSDEYSVHGYRGRRILNILPILQAGPTYVGSAFGLNQMSGGVQLSAGDWLGGDRFRAWGVLGKNFKEPTDLNTDFGVFMERRLLPAVTSTHVFNPNFFVGYRRREIDYVVASNDTTTETLAPASLYLAGTGDGEATLIPDATQIRRTIDTRKDRIKDVLAQTAVGMEVPLGRRHEFIIQYIHRNFDENLTLDALRERTQFQVVQDSIDITETIPPELANRDTSFVDRDDPFVFYEGLNFYSSDALTLAWQYRLIKPTEDRAMNPTGRSVSLVYRYAKSTVADSLVTLTPTEGVPQDPFSASRKPLTINEYVGRYAESIGLPFYNSIQFEVLGAYRNMKVAPRRFYWPLRYYIGGRAMLSGYPYFTDSGSKLLYGRASYRFPVFRRLRTDFLNFTLAKLYAELFTETGAVGNFQNFGDANFSLGSFDAPSTSKFLSDVGAQLDLELFTFYRLPMKVFFQVAHPLNRERVRGWERQEVAEGLGLQEWTEDGVRDELALGSDEEIPRASDPALVDKFRFYFGLEFNVPRI